MNRPARQRVLVLGAAGFFGGWICRELGDREFEVLPAGRDTGDLLDPEKLRRLVAASEPDAVVNAAGMTSPAAARANPADCFAINAAGVLNLLEAIRHEAPRAQLVALSSAAVYAGEPPFSEGSMTAADGPYAASKLAMEMVCGQYSRSYGLAVTVLRCFNLVGPGEPATQATTEFTLAALSATNGRAEVRVGEPSTARDFTDVRDAARAVGLVLEGEVTGTFNLCSGKATSLAWLAETIGRITGVEIVLTGSGTGQAASGQLRTFGDAARLKAVTGWQPGISLEASLGDLISARHERG